MSIKAWDKPLHEHTCRNCGTVEVSPHPSDENHLCGPCFAKDWREKHPLPPERHKEIEFTRDREEWHAGRAEKGDLFYRTRTVIDGEPTEWKAFLLPSCFIGVPVWQVWHLIQASEPYSVEDYDAFDEDLQRIKDGIYVGQAQDRLKKSGIHYSDQ